MWDDVWNNTKALNGWSSLLFGLSLLGMLYGAGHYVVHLPIFPIRAMQLEAAPQRAEVAQIEAAAGRAVRGNFFTVDLEAVRRTFEEVPWVRAASVRRAFPWKLEIALEEQVALARWDSGQLVNTHGEVFAGETSEALPKFSGQPDSAAEVTRMYRALSEQLAPLDQKIAQISLSPRHAWQLRLENGTVLELGREQAEQRLARYVAAYPRSLATLPTPPRYVDLRYGNGFAAYFAGGRA
ncbi:MAG: cell division protein FtsQ/DivIB [Gallionellaceae bacterium]|jgi:cell division protein FtsQ|nr:cell division protein FtsQ/DivIB [Gallionellaceae bacterium]